MKKLLAAMFVALLMAGCGQSEESVQNEAKDDPSVPLLISCAACGEKVSKSGEACEKCGHPTSVNVFKAKTLLALAQEEKSSPPSSLGQFPGLRKLSRENPFEHHLRKTLKKPFGQISPEELLSVEKFNASYAISDLTPIVTLKNLKVLNLGHLALPFQLADIAPLAELTKLEHLKFNGSQKFSDLSPLSGLTSLKHLSLFIQSGAPQLDLAPLGNLKALTDLSLGVSGTKPVNVNALAKLANLRRITLFAHANDISPFSDLKHLEELKVIGPAVSDLAPLADLTSLRKIDLSCASPDLSALAKLVNLESLRISQSWEARDDKTINLTPLANMTKLESLVLLSGQVSDVTPLKNLVNLKHLSIPSGGKVTDIQALSNFANIEVLSLGGNTIASLSPLENLINLQELNLRNNALRNLSPLSKLVNLKSLNLSQTSLVRGRPINLITDVSPLKGLAKLEKLSLWGHKIPDDQQEMLIKALPNCSIQWHSRTFRAQ